MKQIIVIEDRDFINELEKLQYEVESRKFILAYMINSDMNIKSNGFKEYQEDFYKIFKNYQIKKQEVEQKFIRPKINNPKFWNLNFQSGELEIEC